MFSRPIKRGAAQLRIKLVTSDRLFEERLKRDITADSRFHLDVLRKPIDDAAIAPDLTADCAVLLVDIDPHNQADITALATITSAGGTPVIVISDELGGTQARRLLHLKIADWLPKTVNANDLRQACQVAATAKTTDTRAHATTVYSLYSAIGGSGCTTLAAALGFTLARRTKKPQSVCLVDLDLQSGALAEVLDLPANVQLADLVARPERLDAHLVEVLLSRHASGLSLLAAPNALDGFDGITPELVSRLLDLVATKFDALVVDLPRSWQPWSADVLRASDQFFVVTDLSVPGLRQARRIVEECHNRFGLPTKGRVLVNKTGWFGTNGVKKNDAYEALGERLAGFVSDSGSLAAEARNRGVPLSELKRSNRIEKDIEAVLAGQERNAASAKDVKQGSSK